jgi:ribonuclease D
MEYVTNVLKYLFLNEDIRKVFFDCKKDIEAMHFIMGIGVKNIFDA